VVDVIEVDRIFNDTLVCQVTPSSDLRQVEVEEEEQEKKSARKGGYHFGEKRKNKKRRTVFHYVFVFSRVSRVVREALGKEKQSSSLGKTPCGGK
jgi:hypothetical protein